MRSTMGKIWGLAGTALVVLASGCEDPVVKAFDYAASSPVYSTPAITKDQIIFGSENGEVVALNKSGEFMWKYGTRRDVVGAIKVSENLVLFGSTNNTFYALDLAGREVWKFNTLARIKGDPLVVGKTVIFGSYDKHLYALNLSNGRRAWVYPDDDGAADAAVGAAPANNPMAPPPPPPNGAPPPPPNGTAPPPSPNGAKNGKDAKDPKAAAAPEPPPPPVVEKIVPGDGFSYSSPVLVGENVVLGNLDGYVYAVNAQTGAFAWRFKTDGADAKKGVTSTVVETADALVFGANDSNVYAISKDGKSVKWKFKTGDEVNATATLDSDGNIYIGGVDQLFYSLDATGKERWRFQLKGPAMGRGALVDNLVVFGGGAGDNSIYAVDRSNGKLFWSTLTNGKVETDVVAEGNRIYVASGDRRMFCFQFNKTKN